LYIQSEGTGFASSVRERLPKERGYTMKKMRKDPDMLEEYDFSHGVRGKYAKRYAEGTNLVAIDPDVAEYFPDHDAVNESLRGLVAIMKKREKAEHSVRREAKSRAR
jgi:hypothetical protein